MVGFTKNKYMCIHIKKLRIYPATIMLTSLVASVFSPVYAAEKPHTQQFVVTAYYSPLPNQCCYFRGNYEDEITFNGEGIKGADGTGVYPGMLAGPPTYAFGTVIDLPGIGVGTIHDRGGRIVEWGDDIHRIDIWMGYGEEGLARALAWGARKVTGTVYPEGSEGMPKENIAFDSIPADTSSLALLPKTDAYTVLLQAKFGEQNYGARLLQNTLKELGYFDAEPNGNFGPATQDALQKFLLVTGIPGDSTKVTDLTAAALISAQSIKKNNLPGLAVGLAIGSSGNDVRQSQKLLRYLGYYRGRTDGVFDQNLKESVTAFQLDHGVIKQALQNGAGRIGPSTQEAILVSWKAKIVRGKAEAVREKMQLAQTVKTQALPTGILSSGDHGTKVKQLQKFLADAGFLAAKDITGTFGSRTKTALLNYQLDRKIVTSESAHGAGVFGPATRQFALKDAVEQQWQKVRAGIL
jgi:peptidoglycan hydrolase-like protein with peptidoglycan-binding domain/3D (Asp-Asp-Asp) domain-containing protein